MMFAPVYLFLIAAALLIGGLRMILYILSVKKENSYKIFCKINEWYGLIRSEAHRSEIIKLEEIIDDMFEKKVHKTSVLNLNEKFIRNYFQYLGLNFDEKGLEITFEDISRIGLKKSKQSLKLISLALRHNFSLENYPFLNYWYILRGNSKLYFSKKKDPEDRIYTLEDIEEPLKVLEFYFKK